MPDVSHPWLPVTQREVFLTSGADPSTQEGLEIGALHNPIVPPASGCKIRFVDYASTAVLKERHASHPDWVARMVDVDYVWQGSGSLSDIIGARDVFDYVIASHVIEHVPNMLGWFRGISDVMKTGGVFNLACPDKRFTFDIVCPDSTVGELVEADLYNYVRPSVRQMFDHCYYAKAIEPGEIWTNRINVDERPPYSGAIAPRLALDQAHKIMENDQYIDSHCWIFTPTSFLALMRGAVTISEFPLMLDNITPTPLGSFEFYVTFKKKTVSWSEGLRNEQLQVIDRLLQSCLDQQRWSKLLSG